ncbi:unnamed protein product, partial [Ectocarpus sp. 4 AP-2014]
RLRYLAVSTCFRNLGTKCLAIPAKFAYSRSLQIPSRGSWKIHTSHECGCSHSSENQLSGELRQQPSGTTSIAPPLLENMSHRCARGTRILNTNKRDARDASLTGKLVSID